MAPTASNESVDLKVVPVEAQLGIAAGIVNGTRTPEDGIVSMDL